jgi:benzaldehyde dehydrogenase (NAD)
MSSNTANDAATADGEWAGKIFNGQWIDAEKQATRDVVSPLDGRVVAVVGEASPGDVARAAASAVTAGEQWNQLGVSERVAIFNRAADIIQRDSEEIRRWIQSEVGSVPGMTAAEIEYGTEIVRQAAALAAAPRGEILPPMKRGQFNYARRVPRGVVGVIGPWNAPFMLSLRSVAPALALGNAVVLKPAPQTPVSGGILIAKTFAEAGLPAGVLHLMAGDVDTGSALVADPNVHSISFTGSTAVGRSVGRVAGELLKPVQLELGGNNAFIVLDDADLDAAIQTGLACSVFANGQGCLCVGRHLVHESLVGAYTEALTAAARNLKATDPRQDPNTFQGPLINQRQVDRVVDLVKRAEAAGARRLCGDEPDGLYFPAIVLDNVTVDNPIFQEETFAPVIAISSFKTDEEAIQMANSTEYGLTSAIYSRDVHRAAAIGEKLRVGSVHINEPTTLAVAWAPLCGVGASGNGAAFGGNSDLDAYTRWKWFTQNSGSAGA